MEPVKYDVWSVTGGMKSLIGDEEPPTCGMGPDSGPSHDPGPGPITDPAPPMTGSTPLVTGPTTPITESRHL